MSFLGPCSSSSERLRRFRMFRHLYIAWGPTRTPQSAQGPPVPQSASIRTPPCAHKMQIRLERSNLELHGPNNGLKVVPEALCAAFRGDPQRRRNG
eukprot:1789584-Alexandrium_andersonii.AAC.1